MNKIMGRPFEIKLIIEGDPDPETDPSTLAFILGRELLDAGHAQVIHENGEVGVQFNFVMKAGDLQ